MRRSVVVAAVLLALGVGSAAAGSTYPDPSRDVRGGAGPDLTSISVSHTAGAVTFRFRFAAAPPLGAGVAERWVDMLIVGVDVPPRSLKRTVHGWLGADYYLGTHGGQKTAILIRPSRTGSEPGTVTARPKVTVTGRTLSVSVARRALGNPAWIEFAVAAGREGSQAADAGEDDAPARGAFHYRLTR